MTHERLAETIDQLHALFEPVLEREGFELVSLRLHRDRATFVLKLAIDRSGRVHYRVDEAPAGARALDGVTIAECARVHRLLKGIVDGEGVLGDDYSMEVSSPGVNRPLTKPSHFRKATGLKVRIASRVPVSGTSRFVARLVEANDDGVVLSIDDAQIDLSYRLIREANVEYEF